MKVVEDFHTSSLSHETIAQTLCAKTDLSRPSDSCMAAFSSNAAAFGLKVSSHTVETQRGNRAAAQDGPSV